MQKLTLSVLLASLTLLGCGPRGVNSNVNPALSLESLQHMTDNGSRRINQKRMSKIREMGLKETALSLGAQSGLAFRAKRIDEELTQKARYLDTIFDFNQLILEHNILPPVLLEGRHTLNMADTQTIRVSNRVYKVSKQARFITTAPNWRQYLWLDYKSPETPDVSLLPKTPEERQVWIYYVTRGWKQGVEQANTILEENLARIKEDVNGMILYRKLLAMNIVSAPYVSHTELGVTGDGSEIHIDDRVLRITALPVLNPNSHEWRAAVAKDDVILAELGHLEERILKAKVVIKNRDWHPNIAPVG